MLILGMLISNKLTLRIDPYRKVLPENVICFENNILAEGDVFKQVSYCKLCSVIEDFIFETQMCLSLKQIKMRLMFSLFLSIHGFLSHCFFALVFTA